MTQFTKGRLCDAAVLITGWLLFLLYAYPGYMSYDSAWQLSQARGLEPLSDWHPPMMAFIWRMTDAVWAGPFPMLAIQSIAFLVGTYALLRRLTRWAAVVASVLLLLPNNIIVMAAIWKDAQMAGFLLVAIALLLRESRWRLGGFAFVFLAAAVRYNAAAATFPIVLIFWTTRDLPSLKRCGIGVAIWLALTLAAIGANKLLTEEERNVFATGSAPVDIYGAIRFSDTDTQKLVSDHPNVPWQRREQIKSIVDTYYKPTLSFLTVFEGDGAIMRYPVNDAERTAIKALWREMLTSHPGAFVRHRYEVAKAQLGARVPVVYEFAPRDGSAERLHLDTTYWSAQLAWAQALQPLVRSKLFRPGMYFVLAIVLLAFARRQRLGFAILASGIAHELGLFLLAPAVDYRYSHWMVCATILATIVLFMRRRQGTA